MPTSTVRYLRGLAAGLAFLVVPLLVAWAASADTSLVGQMMPYGFMVTVAWWLAVIAGTAVAVGNTHRMTAGVIVGVVSVVLLQGSIALLQAPEMRVETFTSLRVWEAAIVTVALPWLIGAAFGWSMIHRHPLRNDGVASDGDS